MEAKIVCLLTQRGNRQTSKISWAFTASTAAAVDFGRWPDLFSAEGRIPEETQSSRAFLARTEAWQRLLLRTGSSVTC